MHEIIIQYITLLVSILSLVLSFFTPTRVAKLNNETQKEMQERGFEFEAEKVKKTEEKKNLDELKNCILNYQTSVDKILKADEYELKGLEDTYNRVKNELELALSNNAPNCWDQLNQEIAYIFDPEPNTSYQYYQRQALPFYVSVKKALNDYVKEQEEE